MEEPDLIYRWTVYLFASGVSSIVGVMTVFVAMILSVGRPRSSIASRSMLVIIFCGCVLLILCGSMPIPLWLKLVSILLLIIFVGLSSRRKQAEADGQLDGAIARVPYRAVRLFVAVCWVMGILWGEVPFLFWEPRTAKHSVLLVIGDSVTAGLNDGEQTWPRLLANSRQLLVFDASQPGATLKSARQQNASLPHEAGLLVLEIGGNDMLESVPITTFEADLNRLLSEVNIPGREVVMFELPLPPFHESYGRIQREAAAKFRVRLIPKREFARVLTMLSATVDGIHLSFLGQQRMAELMDQLLGQQLVPSTPEYHRIERPSHRSLND